MAGNDNRGQVTHIGELFGGKQPIWRGFRRHTAVEVKSTARSIWLSRDPGALRCACMPGFRAKFPLSRVFLRAEPGEKRQSQGQDEAFQRAKGGDDGQKKGEKPLFSPQQG